MKKVKAEVSFVGNNISMIKGEERELVESDMLSDLITSGYVISIEQPETEDEKTNVAPEQPEQPETEDEKKKKVPAKKKTTKKGGSDDDDSGADE